MSPQPRDGGGGDAPALVRKEAGNGGVYHLAGCFRLGAPGILALGGRPLQILQVEQESLVDPVDRRVDIAWDRKIDQKDRPLAALHQRPRDHLFGQLGAAFPDGGDDDIGIDECIRKSIHGAVVCPDGFGRCFGAPGNAVEHRDRCAVTVVKLFRQNEAELARAEQYRARPFQRAMDRSEERRVGTEGRSRGWGHE